MTPLRLQPPLKDYLWGGTRLKERFHKDTPDLPIVAESWELSCHPAGESVIASGKYAGQTLSQYLEDHPEAAGTAAAKFDRFPMLIKLIDAKEKLSLQVHPADDYAKAHEGDLGKTELWLVLDAEPGAEILYGMKKPISPEEFAARIEDNTLLEVVRAVPVHKGDVFFIEAGTLHGIGAGILVAEVQQNSNVTYRVYDYDRRGADGKPRALHLPQAKAVTTLDVAQNRRAQQPPMVLPQATGELLASCDYFRAVRWTVAGEFRLPLTKRSFVHLLVLEGQFTLAGQTLAPGDSLFCPADEGAVILAGEGVLLAADLPEE